MGNTSFILLRNTQHRNTQHDGLGLTQPATQFAELTGAYWMEPIYAGLANEWSRQGRTVPGTSGRRLQILAEGPDGPAAVEEPPGDAVM
ncbi:MAG TPA: hypothetical protein VGO89_01685 [Streptomyces sp.]|jgi:hypothetical protein|nr:hypothetical protein [Streptomyces sp.]